ncbi:MAG: IS21 family transposase [Sphaerochaetaceae bacterium]
MTNYKEILRMYCGGYSQRAIASSLGCSRDAVSLCIKRVKEKGLSLPISESVTNEELRAKLYERPTTSRDPQYLLPDFNSLNEELQKPHVTKGLLWAEYLVQAKSKSLKGYSISQFNSLFNQWSHQNNPSLSQNHRPGEVLELDWSGSSLLLSNKLTDDTIKCHLFVATFPFSGYFYAQAFSDEKLHSWITATVNALTFFEGVPLILRPDNLKSAIIKTDKYEPTLNVAMVELAEHYKTAVIPARVKSPRDKNVVEGTVGYASRQIIGALRNQKFFSLEDMNNSIWELMDKLNADEFKKKDGSRLLLFKEIEQKELLPLPLKPFELFERRVATVAPDYHIQFAKAFYSVPPKYIKDKVLVKASVQKVFIYDRKSSKLIAQHSRCRFKGQRSTDAKHIHDRHADYLLWSGPYFLSQSRRIGPFTQQMIGKILASREFEVQSYRSCVGVLRIAKRFGATCLEKACESALQNGFYSYKAINTIAKTLKEADEYSQVKSQNETNEIPINDLYCIHQKGGSK